MSLFDSLENYKNSNPIRFHMPGHKGKPSSFDIYDIDITEITGFDDLHNPKGLIKSLEEDITSLYGASSSKFLVNGATVGILSAIFSMVNENDTVLISRFSHKSIFNALQLRKATPVFYNQEMDNIGIPKPVSCESLQEKIKENDIKLTIITSPTYEGVVSNIKDISALLKKYSIPLLVDASHGAHFCLSNNSFDHPISHGADIAVTGLHKTMPFLTQTAALLISKTGEKYKNKIDYYLNCFETSSPSYVLMAAGDRALTYLKKDGRGQMSLLNKNLKDFYKRAQSLKYIEIVDYPYKDLSKIIIKGINTKLLSNIKKALKENNIITEMEAPGYILCMSSLMNTQSDFDRLYDLLKTIDKEFNDVSKEGNDLGDCYCFNNSPKLACSMDKAIFKGTEYIPVEEAEGRVCGDFVEMFPPDIPILIPGEIIEKNTVALVKNLKEHNINIRGIKDNKILVL